MVFFSSFFVVFFLQVGSGKPLCIEPDILTERTLSGVKQFFVLCEKEEWKLDTLVDVFTDAPTVETIVFCTTPSQVVQVQKELMMRGINCAALSDNIDDNRAAILVTIFVSHIYLK